MCAATSAAATAAAAAAAAGDATAAGGNASCAYADDTSCAYAAPLSASGAALSASGGSAACRSSSRRGLRRSPRAKHGSLLWRQRRAGRQRGAERPCRCRASPLPCRCRARLPPSGAPPHSRRPSPRRVARPAGLHPTAAARATCACDPTAARGFTADGLWNGTRRTTRRSARSTPQGPTRTPSWSDG